MGLRSTICSEFYASGQLPEWFKKKYNQTHIFPCGLFVVSKVECKYYANDFFEDYQKAIKESGFWKYNPARRTSIVVLAEDGFVSKVVIYENDIKYYWLSSGEEEENENNNVWQQ
jgi:hypothetical protein